MRFWDSAPQVKERRRNQNYNDDYSRYKPAPNETLDHAFSFQIQCASRTAARVHVQQVSAITTRLRTHRFLSHRPFMK